MEGGQMEGGEDLRANFEAALGERLALDLDPRELRRATGTRSPQDEIYVTVRDITVSGATKECVRQFHAEDITGRTRTGNDGSVQFLLSQYYCANTALRTFLNPVNFVATPHTRVPCFLTATASLVLGDGGSNSDVQIRVQAWDPNGQAAPDILFHWRCLVPWVPNIQ